MASGQRCKNPCYGYIEKASADIVPEKHFARTLRDHTMYSCQLEVLNVH